MKRLWDKVSVWPPTDCWLWQSRVSPGGYGEIHFKGRTKRAHRIAYELSIGPIPKGLQLDHLCRNRSCCNPKHLEPVTQAVNIQRGDGALRFRLRTHCPAGHEYSPDNTYLYDGRRSCIVCHNAANVAYRSRIKMEDVNV